MIHSLYLSIHPSLWDKQRKVQWAGDFGGETIRAHERVRGVAQLVGKDARFDPRLRKFAIFMGTGEALCEIQLTNELVEALESKEVKNSEFVQDMRHELRLVIKHEGVCCDCYKALEMFCDEKAQCFGRRTLLVLRLALIL
jgi:hypothetical protein